MFVRIRDAFWGLSPKRLSLSLVGLAVLKVGLQRSDGIDTFTTESQSADEFTSFYRSSPIMRLIAQVLPLTTEVRWVLFHLLMTAVFLVVAYIAARRLFPTMENIGLTLVYLSPLVTVAFTEIGRYDIYLLIGSLLLVVGGRLLGVVGALLIFFANFEQGLVVFAAIAVLALSSEITFDRLRILASMAVGVGASLAYMLVTYAGQSGSDSRLDALQRNLKGAALANFTSLPLLAFSSLGLLWVVFLYWLSQTTSLRNVLLHTSAIFAIPFVATYFTLDGTRVFVCSAAVPVLLVLAHLGRTVELDDASKKRTFTIVLALGVLLPMFSVFVDGYVKEPYIEVYRFFRN